MFATVLAHALPQSVGGVPLTLVLTLLIAAFLAVNAAGTRRASSLVGTKSPSTATAGRARGDGAAAGTGAEPTAEPDADTEMDGSPSRTTADGKAGAGATWTAPDALRPGPAGMAAGVTLAVATVVLSIAGPTDAANNLTDIAVLSLGWSLIALTSILAGAWWLAINPVNGLSGLLERLAGSSASRALSPTTSTVATVVLLLGWAAAQLLVDFSPTGFAILALLYVVGHALAAGALGTAWLGVEPTNVLTQTMGLLRPSGGGPLRRLVDLEPDGRLGWVAATLIGWSLTDLVLETSWWHDLGLATGMVLPVGLLALTGVVVLLGLLIRATSRRVGLTPAFVAVAGGWVVAHYLSILLIDGQGIPIWLSDPFGTGANLLGQRDAMVNLEPLPTGVITALQIIPFLAGHVLAVAVVQRRAAKRVRSAAQLGAATLEARALIGVLLLGGAWMQLAGL